MSIGSWFMRGESSADYVALDWESGSVRAVAARIAAGRLTLLGAASIDWPADGFAVLSPAAVRLQQAVRGFGLKSPRALFVLPRDLVVTRKLDLPAVPDSELPDLVRLQAATKLATPVDRLALDYLPLPAAEQSAGRSVLLTSVDQDRLQRMSEVARAAGLEPFGCVTSSIGVAELVVRTLRETSGLNVIVYQHRQRLELIALQGLQPIFSHSLTVPDEDRAGQRQSFLAELSRVVVAVRQVQHAGEIDRVLVVQDGGDDEWVLAVLRERFGDRIRRLDSDELRRGAALDAPLPAGASTAAVGALVAEASPLLPAVDFLRPRRAPRQADPRRRQMQIAAAAAAAVVFVSSLIYYGLLSSRDRRIAELKDRQSELEALLNRPQSRETLAAAAALNAWSAEAALPLAVLGEFQPLLPGTDRLYFTSLRFSPEAGQAVARLTGNGFARRKQDVDDLNQRLADAGHLVTAKPHATATRNPDYPVAFELNVSIRPPQLVKNVVSR